MTCNLVLRYRHISLTQSLAVLHLLQHVPGTNVCLVLLHVHMAITFNGTFIKRNEVPMLHHCLDASSVSGLMAVFPIFCKWSR